MDLKLKVIEGKHAGQEIAISGNKFIIGRAEDCHLRPGSDMVSRHHCVILVEETYVGVRDFGSKNGTLVNGERVAGECELKHGDQIKVGPLEFELVVNHKLGGKKRSAVHDVKEAAARTAEGPVMHEVDVTQWLTGDTGLASGETQRVKASDTLSMPVTPVAAPAAPVAEDLSTIPTPHMPGDKRTIGKLPPQPTITGKNSQDAAAKMLEQLRKRR